MEEKMDSLVDQAKSTAEAATVNPASFDEPRRLKTDEAEHIIREAERRQERWGETYWGMPVDSGPVPTLDVLVEEAIEGRNIPPDQRDRLLAVARSRQDQRDAQRRDAGLRQLAETVGPRFAAATLKTFEATTAEQRKVLAAIRGYAMNVVERAAEGDGVILFGSAGTGKTHLLAGLARVAIESGLTVAWTNGQDLFAKFRAAIDGEGSEAKILSELVKADILVLDDLLPPGGVLTEYQSGMTFRIVDCRYRGRKPTMVSANVASGSEAERGAGAQTIDRLRHGSLTLYFSWASYRKAKQ